MSRYEKLKNAHEISQIRGRFLSEENEIRRDRIIDKAAREEARRVASQIEVKPEAVINRSLSHLVLIDRVVVTMGSRLSIPRSFIRTVEKIRRLKIHEGLNDESELSDSYLIEQLESAKGIEIEGINYKISMVFDPSIFWLFMSKFTNHIRTIKPVMIKLNEYDIGKEGKPYHMDNFIQDYALTSNINWVVSSAVNEVYEAYSLAERAMKQFILKKYSRCLELLEVNIAINSEKVEEDFEAIKEICPHSLGEPILGGAPGDIYVDYEISEHKRIKFYKKVHPSVDGKVPVPGMIRAELVVGDIPFKAKPQLYAATKEAMDNVKSIAGYVYSCLATSRKVKNEVLEAFDSYSDVQSAYSAKEDIPIGLVDYYLKLDCSGLKMPYVLLPEIFKHFYLKGV